jgi:hypothetical protein
VPMVAARGAWPAPPARTCGCPRHATWTDRRPGYRLVVVGVAVARVACRVLSVHQRLMGAPVQSSNEQGTH